MDWLSQGLEVIFFGCGVGVFLWCQIRYGIWLCYGCDFKYDMAYGVRLRADVICGFLHN